MAPWQFPIASAGVWTRADAGQVELPPFPLPGMADPTQVYAEPWAQWAGSSSTTYEADVNWLALVPIDGSLLYGQLINPSNSGQTVTNQWLWVYADGLLVNRASAQDGPALAYSAEGLATPNVAHAAGGTGTSTSGVINVNGSADPYLTLDPALTLPGQSGGINQIVALLTDSAGTVLPIAGDLLYSPLYLWPR